MTVLNTSIEKNAEILIHLSTMYISLTMYGYSYINVESGKLVVTLLGLKTVSFIFCDCDGQRKVVHQLICVVHQGITCHFYILNKFF